MMMIMMMLGQAIKIYPMKDVLVWRGAGQPCCFHSASQRPSRGFFFQPLRMPDGERNILFQGRRLFGSLPLCIDLHLLETTLFRFCSLCLMSLLRRIYIISVLV